MSTVNSEFLAQLMKLLELNETSHDIDHTLRVRDMAMRIGREINDNDDKDMLVHIPTLELAALMHDLCRHVEDIHHGAYDHAVKGAALASVLLNEAGYDYDTIGNVCHCIKSHRFRNKHKPETLEAKVLYDADKLDAMGVIGIGRSMIFCGEHGNRLHIPNLDVSKTRPYQDDWTPYAEFKIKLEKLKDNLYTDEAKKIAKHRHAVMVMFFEELDKEVRGEL